MSGNYVIRMVEAGKMPMDELCVLVPIMARQNEPAAAELLEYVDRHKLWLRWGFESLSDYVLQTRIPEITLRYSTMLFLLIELNRPCLHRESHRKVRQLIEKLHEDGVVKKSRTEFYDRLEVILAAQQEASDADHGGSR